WFAASGLLLAGADQVFYRRFSRTLWRQVRQLELAVPGLAPGPDRLLVLITLVTAGLCMEGEARLLARASRRLADELDRQILADGCHISRDPGVLVGLVLDLLPLRQLFPARNVTPPPAILTAVDLLADVGRPPPARDSATAHAGCLAFEFSAGREVVIINCGVPAIHRATWRSEARKTAAHSTVGVAQRSSARLGRGLYPRGLVLSGPRHIERSRKGLVVEASHDGYLDREGVIHRRTLALSASGDRLDGIDRISGSDRPWTARFHLHPAVQLIPTENLRVVLLRLPSGEGWRFSADQPIGVEESVALAQAEGPRRTLQLTISVASSTVIPEVGWTLERMVRPRRIGSGDPEPELPL
ncbi:MAG: heparinase II/III family protein, partial [Xanthobacteraceae bacterium]